MKSKYCFLRTDGHLCPDDVIYVVWVGSYFRELAKLTLVEEYCKDTGSYIEKWSCLVDSRLEMEKSRFRKSGDKLSNPFRSVEISINKLYAMILDDSFGRFENEIVMTDFEKWMRFRNTIEYHQNPSKNHVIRNVLPSARKNLSHRVCSENYKAYMAIIGLLGLFLLDALVTGIMSRLIAGSF